jgi:hypothetical protein
MITNSISLKPEFYGETTIILSKRGYGKSHTARVIIEDGKKLGVSFIIIDPQDAYLNLEGFEYIDVRKIKSAKGFADLLSATHKNVVIQVKRLNPADQNKFLKSFLDEYKLRISKGIQCIVIDEMHKYAPETEKSEAKDAIRGMYQENRSDGLGIIGISQRTSRIDKTCLAQADNLAIGKVTAKADKEAVKNYIDNDEDVEKIKNLKIGEFYFCGFGLDEAIVEKVRKSESEHSGGSPKNLLSEDNSLFHKNLSKFYNKKMANEEIPNSEGIHKIIPSVEGFKDLAILGAKVSLGLGASALVSSFTARLKSPLEPYVSSRTLGALGSTIGLYAGYRFINWETPKSILKYATAGSAVYSAGSLVFDLWDTFNIKHFPIVDTILGAMTGVTAMVSKEAESGVDLNTAMQ